MMAGTIVIVEYDALRNRLRRPHSQKLQIRLPELPAQVAEVTMVVPRDAHGAALIDQIIVCRTRAAPGQSRCRTPAPRQRTSPPRGCAPTASSRRAHRTEIWRDDPPNAASA